MAELSAEGEAFTQLLLEVFRVNGLLLEAGNELTRPVGLSSARWQVLGVVEHGPVPAAHVGRIMGLTRQNVQQIADALAREGFIEYRPNPQHRRAKLLTITPKGQEALAYVSTRHAQWASHIGDQHALLTLRAAATTLRQVRESLERDPEESPDVTGGTGE
ncbi:MAG: MarR family winged helix-turn-helix transcriptional regulator [Fimbriimonas sp.]